MSNTIADTSKSLPVSGRVNPTPVAIPIPAPLDSSHAIRELLLDAHPDNDDLIYIGNETAQEFHLAAGESMGIPIGNPGEVWVRSESGTQRLGYLGRD